MPEAKMGAKDPFQKEMKVANPIIGPSKSRQSRFKNKKKTKQHQEHHPLYGICEKGGEKRFRLSNYDRVRATNL